MQNKTGRLFLIPVPIGETPPEQVIPEGTLAAIRHLRVIIAENAKSARAVLKQFTMDATLQEIEVLQMDKHGSAYDFNFYFEKLRTGTDTGLMSEAGMPAVADPGAEFVKQAHMEGIQVVPLTGPSSILLALAASGLNGQGFAFHGYLPKEQQERIAAIKTLERNAAKWHQTQIFIETPYRNQALLNDLINSCSGNTRLCVACNITAADEIIRTMPVHEWKNHKIDLHKKPTIFLIL
ncbi:MAG: SAM-dependent methyltransferase [Bacteroidia bacterium]|nr:SAM-dependent methyltransferase [Bacteroidia bacterium]